MKGDDLMQAAAGDTNYESSSHGYERHRRPDPCIGALIHQHLGAGRSVVNVGAGAGSYEPADRCVLAVEPSAAMRSRRSFTEAVPAINAAAEALPYTPKTTDHHEARTHRGALASAFLIPTGPVNPGRPAQRKEQGFGPSRRGLGLRSR